MSLQGTEIFYYTASVLCLLSALICGTVRWFHMCRPFDKEEQYYYPARKQVTMCYALILFQFPYAIHLASPDTWMYVRVFGILYYPLIFTLLLNRYFHYTARLGWRVSLYAIWAVSVAWLMVLFFFGLGGGNLLVDKVYIVSLWSALLGVLSTVAMCYTIYKVYVDIRQFQYSEYSNEQDFPVRFAIVAISLILFLTGVMWGVYLSNSQMVKAVVDVLLCFLHTLLLVIILHPQRIGKKHALQEAVRSSKLALNLSEERYNEVLNKIHDCLEVNEMFLKPNLQLMDIAQAIGENRSYVSAVIVKEFGSFYNYVNRLRIEYAVRLQEKFPKMKQVELMERCGFGSRTSFIKWQKYYSDSLQS